jgi:CubicO group peptidase (beta-lactamase class C family)
MEDMKITATGYDFRSAHAAMQRYVDENFLSGFSSAVLVGRDLVDVQYIGWADKEARIPLRVDHIFRIFSDTKLITSCAALLLFEEGRFQLDDPVEQFIPQLANRRVLHPDATSLDQTEPAVGPITIRHLMSHSSGLSYGLLDPGTLIFKAYNERKVLNPATTLAEMMDALADLPLVFHPGTSWEYSVATDVLARLVEVISGQRFDAFLQSRILGPLGMVDVCRVGSQSPRRLLCRGRPGRPHEAGTCSRR